MGTGLACDEGGRLGKEWNGWHGIGWDRMGWGWDGIGWDRMG